VRKLNPDKGIPLLKEASDSCLRVFRAASVLEDRKMVSSMFEVGGELLVMGIER
jgi:hypothetical protein